MPEPDLLPGLVRIYEEWEQHHPGVEPLTVQFAAGGESESAVDGVLSYPLDDHWLLVTFGLTELGEKTSPEPKVSGAGFEFTCRLPRDPGDTAPPQWALRVLHALADKFLAGTDLDVGHWIVTSGPLGGDPGNGAMTSLAIVPDAELRGIATPNGVVLFFQVVGLLADEGAKAQESGGVDAIIGCLRDRDPRLVTDPNRPAVALD